MSDGDQGPDDDAGAALPLDRLRVLRLAHALGSGLGPSPDDTVVMVAGMVQLLREAGHDDHALVYALAEATAVLSAPLAEAAAALAEALHARRRRRGRPRGSALPDADADIFAVFAKHGANMSPQDSRAFVRRCAEGLVKYDKITIKVAKDRISVAAIHGLSQLEAAERLAVMLGMRR